MEKHCKKCNTTKPTTEFCKRKVSYDGLQHYCKVCLKKINKGYKPSGESYKRSYTKNNNKRKSFIRAAALERLAKHTLPYWIVYLLPNANYVGKTNNPTYRMPNHRQAKRDTDEWYILDVVHTNEEALEKESYYHSLGFSGRQGP